MSSPFHRHFFVRVYLVLSFFIRGRAFWRSEFLSLDYVSTTFLANNRILIYIDAAHAIAHNNKIMIIEIEAFVEQTFLKILETIVRSQSTFEIPTMSERAGFNCPLVRAAS